MKLQKILFSAALASLVLTSCSNDENDPIGASPVKAEFTSTIEGSVQTRATGNTWDTSDAIGVFMKQGAGLTTPLALNKKHHSPAGDGNFTAYTNGDAIYYPEDGSGVDFIAYYPYQDLVNNVYKVDVSDQSSQSSIDLLYSSNSTNQSKTNPIAALSFTHELTKLVLTVKPGVGVSSLSGMTAKIEGVNTTADFDLSTATLTITGSLFDIFAKTDANIASAISEAILLPAGDVSGLKITFSLPSGTFIWNIPANTSFEKAKKYKYDLELQKTTGGEGSVAVINNATITDWLDGDSSSHIVEQDPDGSKSSPYILKQLASKFGETGKWVTGYIVGISENNSIILPDNATAKTNILIASTASETDFDNCTVVELTDPTIQSSLNLIDNPSLLGQSINIQGDILNNVLGSTIGIANVTAQVGGANTNPGVENVIFNETFGTIAVTSKPKIANYKGWDMTAPISYSDSYATADLRTTTSLADYGNHVWFPANKNSSLKISGISTAGYNKLKLSYDICANVYANTDATDLNVVTVKYNETTLNVESHPVTGANDKNIFYTITLDIIPTGDDMIVEFFGPAELNTTGFRLDNVKITGEK